MTEFSDRIINVDETHTSPYTIATSVAITISEGVVLTISTLGVVVRTTSQIRLYL